MGIRKRLLYASDRFVVGSTELCKALVRENFRLGQQIVLAFSAALMQVVNNDRYYAARRNRIRSGPSAQSRDHKSKRVSGFASLFIDETAKNGSKGSKVAFDSYVQSNESGRQSAEKSRMFDSVSETSVGTEMHPLPRRLFGLLRDLVYWVVDRIVSMLHLALMWLPGMGSRAQRLARLLGQSEESSAKEVELDHEVSTGLLEDVQLRIHLTLEWICWMIRRFLHSVLGSRDYNRQIREEDELTYRKELSSSTLSLRKFRAHTPRREHNFSAAVMRVGYPFQQIILDTADGYRLELHRLPRHNSDKVMFLQHGIMDSSYSFVARGASDGLAFRAFDKGYDVFMGNFRGTSSLKHASEDISACDYWDFTLDDHGNFDLDAFIQEIWKIKQQELGISRDGEDDRLLHTPCPIDITLVAHSMGAAASLIYLVNKRRAGHPHRLSRMVLMSPAGYHHRIPRACRYFGPVLKRLVKMSGVYTLSIPSQSARNLSRKLMQDAVSLPALRDLIYSCGEMFLGGDFKATVHSHVSMVTDNMIAGTSSKVFLQFWNNYVKKRFLSFDYGPEVNLRVYGTETPVDYMAHYHLIDIPIHFMAGLNDNLIPAKDCFKHYKALYRVSPSLATCKPLAGRGHIDFTYGMDQEIASEIFGHSAAVRSSSLDEIKRMSLSSKEQYESSKVGDAGIRLGKNLQVTEILPSGPAGTSGIIKIGDQIVSVNSAVVVGQPPSQVQALISGPIGSQVTLVFTRQGVHKKASFTRAKVGP
uniref:PDZ domain-containing protein n=1 Tax=Guillardia theta TaxID=55529 RepID=A0A7S4KLP2_GUITH|mmetsp:Transcript_26857/g.87895  ORF Transcript_26857/g.87895 Transcript_26857/m.87895 type:complete len:758 (+) Transcript_26857:107-2380(+)